MTLQRLTSRRPASDANAVQRVVDLLIAVEPLLPDAGEAFEEGDGRPAYDHIGALLADVVLQPALNYRTVVLPRVQRILMRWPHATQISALRTLLRRHGTRELLSWNHAEKPARFLALVRCCETHRVETVADLRSWLLGANAAAALPVLRGMGPKSIDYLHRLAGHSRVPMDRHLYRFLALAGIDRPSYEEGQSVFVAACHARGLHAGRTERAVWMFLTQ